MYIYGIICAVPVSPSLNAAALKEIFLYFRVSAAEVPTTAIPATPKTAIFSLLISAMGSTLLKA